MTATLTKTFEFEALNSAGKRHKGKVEAPNEGAAAQAIRSQGSIPLSILESGKGLQKELSIPGLGGRVKLKDLAIFTRQFATMAASGLSLLRCLAILEEQTPNVKLAKTTREVRHDIEQGLSLSKALGKHDKIFPRLMIAMISAGEVGGFLDKALERIAENLEKDANLRAKIKSAMTYPVIVLIFAVLMVAGVLMFIVPVFSKMFKNLHATLPAPTQMLVTASNQMAWLFPLFMIVVVVSFIVIKRQIRTNQAFRLRFDKFKLRLPVFGNLFRKIALSRFSRNFGTLLSVGVPVMQALDIVGATSGNEVINEAMTEVAGAVREGRTISSTLRNSDIFPEMVVNMIEVGEESGQISVMLDKVADFYDHEVDAATEQLAAAIEPVMVVLMGGIVGGVVVALYLPMFTVYQHIGQGN